MQLLCVVMHCTTCCIALLRHSRCLLLLGIYSERRWRSSDLSFVRLLEVELVRVELALAGVILLAEHSQHCYTVQQVLLLLLYQLRELSLCHCSTS